MPSTNLYLALYHVKFNAQSVWFSNRDFCCVYGRREFADGTQAILCRSIRHARLPEEEGYVRGVMVLSGVVVKPLNKLRGHGGRGCEVTSVVHLDLEGWLTVTQNSTIMLKQAASVQHIDKLIKVRRLFMFMQHI